MMKSMLALAAIFALSHTIHADDEVLGQGDFRYRVVKGWAAAALAQVSVKNGHAMALDKMGRVVFLTDDPKNNIIVLSPAGELLETWTARMPGAHGLTLVEEGGREVVFITDTALHEVRKLTLGGEELQRFSWPEASGLYKTAAEYKPSKVLHAGASGEFYVFDGYGKDFVHHYRADGSLLRSWGGTLGEAETQLLHFGPHGGGIDRRDPANSLLLVGMSDRQEVKRFTLDGVFIDKFAMPGGNPRDAVMWGQFVFIPHLGDQWPKDKNAPGFLSVLDKANRIVSNIGGSPAEYAADGSLQPMHATGSAFIHPHGLAVDAAGNIYVAQFSSPAAPLLKLERLP
jgi:peptidylamidoglycolate lyase